MLHARQGKARQGNAACYIIKPNARHLEHLEQAPRRQTCDFQSAKERQKIKVTPRTHARRPTQPDTHFQAAPPQIWVAAAGTNSSPILPRFIYSELCARAAELRIMLRMHNDGQVLLIFIECRAQLFEVDAELGVEKGPEEAQLFY